MSNPFGGFGGSSLVIHQDNSENSMQSAMRKTKGGEMQGKAPATKRAALGVITNTRVQPSRAAKQNVGSDGLSAMPGAENVQTKGEKIFTTLAPQNQAFTFQKSMPVASSQPFAIHVDEPTPTHKPIDISSDDLTLHPSVTSLHPQGSGLESIVLDEPSLDAGSPMLLDTSVDQHRSLVEDGPEQRTKRVLSVHEYTDEIYRYLREAELRNRAKPLYMRRQPDITNSMRSILVDWLVEVSEEYKLHRETLCLSVNYIDRFLSQMSVLRGKLQLVGAASIFLASKYEEIYPPDVGEFVYITDDTYTKKQVLRMEHLILKVLSFDVAIPTVNCFCEKFLDHQGANDLTCSLAMYLIELTLVDSDPYLQYLPSVTAAAAVCLANLTLGQEPWSANMVRSTGYTVTDLQECLRELWQTFSRAPSHPQQAIREKYKQSKYHQVSLLTPPAMLPTAMQ